MEIKLFKQLQPLILAGGQSRRMGSNKALLAFEQGTLIERIHQNLRNFFEPEAVLIGAGFTLKNVPVLPDLYPGEGPLGGLLTAFQYFVSTDFFVCACDMPFLDEKTLSVFAMACEENSINIPGIQGRLQPLAGRYPSKHLNSLASCFASGERKWMQWLTTCTVQEVDMNHYSQAYRNLNTPDDYQEALKWLASVSSKS